MWMKSLAAAAAVTVAGLGGAWAAPLALDGTVTTQVTDNGTGFAIFDTASFGFSYLSDVDGASGEAALAGTTNLTITSFGSVFPEPGTPSDIFVSVDDADLNNLLEGTLLRVGDLSTAADDGTDLLQLLFEVTGGSAAAAFAGGIALLEIVGEFGTDTPLDGFDDGFGGEVPVSGTISSVVPIPLPATGIFLLGGLAGLSLLRRKA